jgi:hypothetical protein
MQGWTELPKVTDPLAFLERIYDHLPPGFAALQGRKAAELSRVALQRAFLADRQGDRAAAGRAVLQAGRYRPAALLNRGALAILGRSLLRPNR